MLYRQMGRGHAALLRLRDEKGQGTVEYVGLMVLMATVMTAVAKFGGDGVNLPSTIVEKIKAKVTAIK